MTHGYRTRRLAVDYSIPLVTDVKCTKLLVEAMRLIGKSPVMKTSTDCMTSMRMVSLPGFIDVHVHLREPGATHKEDFASGTAAALAGGVTMVCAMPNTNPSIIDRTTFNLFSDLAKAGSRCDYALYVGAADTNWSTVSDMALQAAGLKMYLNDTFSTLKMTDMTIWEKHFQHWPKRCPIVCHAERQTMGAVILMAHLMDRPIHVCHLARKEEILLIKSAKEKGVKVTCEVCPHHLFLSTDDIDRIGFGRSEVRPVLCSPEDQQALWDNMDFIDVFATDHAPHTTQEKNSEKPPPGFPGLETILPLLLNAVDEGRLTLEDIKNKFHRNPKKIFNLPDQPNTYVEVDLDEEWVIPRETLHSKAKWTPFTGMKIKGKVHRVVLRGEVAYIDGEVLVPPGFGQNVRTQVFRKPNPYTSLECIVDQEDLNKSIGDVSESQTNDVFNRLLQLDQSPKPNVHFSAADSTVRPISPMPRLRCDSTGNYASLKDLLQKTDPVTAPVPISKLFGKHILSVDMFTKDHLNDIFNLAQIFKTRVNKDRPVDEILKGKVMASMFFEPSTRTSASFGAAMQRLGGTVLDINEPNSSVQKGETLDDTISIMSGYSNVVVLRHPMPGEVEVSVKMSIIF